VWVDNRGVIGEEICNRGFGGRSMDIKFWVTKPHLKSPRKGSNQIMQNSNKESCSKKSG